MKINQQQDALRSSSTTFDNISSLSHDVFKSQVLSYLEPDYQAQYGDPGVWDDMVLRVVESLKGMTP